MTDLFNHLLARIKGRRVLLSDGADPRACIAAGILAATERVSVELPPGSNVKPAAGIRVLSPEEFKAEPLQEKRLRDYLAAKGRSAEIGALLSDPLNLSAARVGAGKVEAAVSGAARTTADVIRAGLHFIDRAPGIKTISSIFFIELRDGRRITYADCGVVPYPDAQQLAEIAVTSAKTHEHLSGEEARVALLSFSTLGSAQHEKVTLVREALAAARKLNPDLAIDGELQFDAAFVPEVAARKAPGSRIAGKANVFIFPNLDAGNIAYKITERIGGATAVGPILQGYSRPWLDLSRGCKAEDIALAALVALACV